MYVSTLQTQPWWFPCLYSTTVTCLHGFQWVEKIPWRHAVTNEFNLKNELVTGHQGRFVLAHIKYEVKAFCGYIHTAGVCAWQPYLRRRMNCIVHTILPQGTTTWSSFIWGNDDTDNHVPISLPKGTVVGSMNNVTKVELSTLTFFNQFIIQTSTSGNCRTVDVWFNYVTV